MGKLLKNRNFASLACIQQARICDGTNAHGSDTANHWLSVALTAVIFGSAITIFSGGLVLGSSSNLPSKSTLLSALNAGCGLNPNQPESLRHAFPGGRLLESRVDQVRGQPGRSVHRVLMPDGNEWSVTKLFPGGRLRRVTVDWYASVDQGASRPVFSMNASADCQVTEARRLIYDAGKAFAPAHRLEILAADLTTAIATELLNPPVPVPTMTTAATPTESSGPGQPVRVAVIDTGVNYTLPLFNARLARNPDGSLVGYDFWDMDDRPFDIDAARSPFFPLRHGTAVTSIILREAPNALIIPYRYPRPDMSRFKDLISHADIQNAIIVNLAMGSNRASDWEAFEEAARAHPHMLFIVSAGNNGRNLDQFPVFPAALELENVLTVTSSDPSGRLARGSNWGLEHVDIMAPGEQVAVVDHRGAQGKASGSSFAVPRISALAARLLATHPEWQAAELKAAILKRARQPSGRGSARLKHGWIPDPTDDFEG